MRLDRNSRGKCHRFGFAGLLAAGAAALLTVQSAKAATVNWATWSTSYTAGLTSGAASASIGTTPPVSVAYSGEVESVVLNYPSWTPSTSYVGGTVDNAPPQSGNIVQLFGGAGSGTDTLTFSQPVTNPVMAIWSLGAGGNTAQFDFTAAEPFTIQAGGPSAEYGGGTITQTGNNVYGAEGNGTIQFTGTIVH